MEIDRGKIVMDSGEPESDYYKDMIKMREEFKRLPQNKKDIILKATSAIATP